MHLTVEAKVENVDEVISFVNDQLKGMGCTLRAKTQIDIALDELFSNICHYAYGDSVGHATIRVQEVPEKNAVRITLEDSGVPFNPLEREDPDVTLDLHERTIGGLGIFMVKKTMNDVQYEYRDGLNTLTVLKTI
ncbi:MAG: ATP-binding protein [Coriobacteriales bacterium]|nr:ATP-binding protein [Coriobacteriales bacterium]